MKIFAERVITSKVNAMSGKYRKCAVVDSQLGERKIDSEGAPISGVRMDVSKAYAGVPGLLQKVIKESDIATRTETTSTYTGYSGAPGLLQRVAKENDAWAEIKNKIDYIYSNLDCSLAELDKEIGFGSKVQSQIKLGKKYVFSSLSDLL
jgi:hypothetical protein